MLCYVMLWQGQRAKRQTIGIVSVFVGHVAHAHPLTQQVLANNGEVRISKLTFFYFFAARDYNYNNNYYYFLTPVLNSQGMKKLRYAKQKSRKIKLE